MKAAVLLLSACLMATSTYSQKRSNLFQSVSREKSGIEFTNVNDTTQDAFLPFSRPPRLYYRGGAGTAIADLDNDGLQDVLLLNNIGAPQLFLNRSEFKFQDATKGSGLDNDPDTWHRAVSVLDINEDGRLDLYLCNSAYAGKSTGKNQLFINKGGGHFVDKASEYGLDDPEDSFQASFFDYDRDGDLDLFLITHIEEKNGGKAFHSTERIKEHCQKDKLYRNDDGRFVDVTSSSGIENCALALNSIVTDLNQDGWADIFISNDFIVPDRVFINQKDGTFKEQSERFFDHYSFSSMGSDFGDVNNDGLPDLFTLDMLPEENMRQKVYSGMIIPRAYYRLAEEGLYYQNQRNCLFINNGNGFDEVGQLSGVYKTDWSWGTILADLDNDGLQDIFVTNTGMFNALALEYGLGSKVKKENFIAANLETSLTNYAFKNNGSINFEDVTDSWGFGTKTNSTGLAVGDLDNDGDLDLVCNNLNEPATVYQNKSRDNRFVQVIPLKTKKTIDFGASVILHSGDKHTFCPISTSRGYLSASQPAAHFGLGETGTVDSVTVRWSDGTESIHHGLSENTTHKIKKKLSTPFAPMDMETVFNLVDTSENGFRHIHKENGVIDFDLEKLLPHALSRFGPGVAVGDINGDDRDDIVVGGATGQSANIFLRSPDGNFIQTSSSALNKDRLHEDLGLLLEDIENDGDLDLIITSGGYADTVGHPNYKDRLYLNNGTGSFADADYRRLLVMNESSSCVVAADFDKDGDRDLFIGGRAKPFQYPKSPKSRLLQNNDGYFVDVTDSLAIGLRDIGMVTSAIWSDYDMDGDVDLLLVGEWMGLTVFQNADGLFKNVSETTGIERVTGWWNSINGGDFDHDGDMDYILGNLGSNNKFDVSEKSPLQIHYNDFDGDAKGDIVLSYTSQEKVVPVRGRVCSSAQMPLLAEEFGSSRAFGESNLFQIFDNERLEQSLQYTATEFRSCYAQNLGNGSFRLEPLPVEAQVAPIFGTAINDFNGDSYLDIALVGNNFWAEVETGRYDALKGLILLGDGTGKFGAMNQLESGFRVSEDAKGLAQIITDNEVLLISTQNNDHTLIHKTLLKSSKTLRFKSDISHGFVLLANGKKRYFELFSGSGYLSSGSRSISIPETAIEVEFYNSSGNKASYSVQKK